MLTTAAAREAVGRRPAGMEVLMRRFIIAVVLALVLACTDPMTRTPDPHTVATMSLPPMSC